MSQVPLCQDFTDAAEFLTQEPKTYRPAPRCTQSIFNLAPFANAAQTTKSVLRMQNVLASLRHEDAAIKPALQHSSDWQWRSIPPHRPACRWTENH